MFRGVENILEAASVILEFASALFRVLFCVPNFKGGGGLTCFVALKIHSKPSRVFSNQFVSALVRVLFCVPNVKGGGFGNFMSLTRQTMSSQVYSIFYSIQNTPQLGDRGFRR